MPIACRDGKAKVKKTQGRKSYVTCAFLFSYAKATTLAHKPDCSGLRSNRQASCKPILRSWPVPSPPCNRYSVCPPQNGLIRAPRGEINIDCLVEMAVWGGEVYAERHNARSINISEVDFFNGNTVGALVEVYRCRHQIV